MTTLGSRLLLAAGLWTFGLVIIMSSALVMTLESQDAIRHLVGVHDFFKQPLVLLVAVISMIAGLVQVRRGMMPIKLLRTRLSQVHGGHERRVSGIYPAEVQPLVNDLNALLDHREEAVRRAVAKAGDLAHGLKTPLAILAQEAERAGAGGHRELAIAVEQQVHRMRRQVDYHLAHARAAASGSAPGTRTSIRESADGLARALSRLYADRLIAIDVHVPDDVMVRVEREDLDEMLGNLLDNACKWGRSRVVMSASRAGAQVEVSVEDDGIGLPESACAIVVQRGVRADQAVPGSGLGLAIVRDLAVLYNGSLLLDAADLGGVRARLRLPSGDWAGRSS